MSDGGASADGPPAPAVSRSAAELRAVVAAHGLGGRAILPMQATGIANDIWALGDDLVLRIGRAWEEAIVDEAFAGRVLWNQIGHSLRKAANPRPGRPASAGIDRLHRLRAWTSRATGRWRAWLPTRSP